MTYKIHYIIRLVSNKVKITGIIILVIFVCLLWDLGEALAATCINTTCSDSAGPCRTDADCGGSAPRGQPFLPLTQPKIPTEGLPGFGQLIAMIFTWSLNILGIVVFVMLFYAGFKWFTAAGNTAKVNEAKNQITNAITGAIILLAAYIILYTINPDFVRGNFILPGIQSSNTNQQR